MDAPQVSIIGLCYNHHLYLDEALRSIENLNYTNLQVLIADDASTDNSVALLRLWEQKKPGWKFWFNVENQGNCKTFNHLLSRATGDFVLDFALDDVLETYAMGAWAERLVANPNAAFCYADAWLFHHKTGSRKLFSTSQNRTEWPQGSVLNKLFGRPFICPPAVLFRTSALVKIGGYTEHLAYEDWDVWLRLARYGEVVRQPEPVLSYRIHSGSLSASLFEKRNVSLIDSTLSILENVLRWEEVTRIPDEVAHFLRYHLKVCAVLGFYPQGMQFWDLLNQIAKPRLKDRVWYVLIRTKIPVYWAVNWLRSVR